MPTSSKRLLCFALFLLSILSTAAADDTPLAISGRYPHLAVFNHGGECGIGAVVPWAGHLWFTSYPPHKPTGSDDKLYEVDEQLKMVARPESIGGTSANRLIHRESKQLFIGPYVIDADGAVRVIPYRKAPGRPTATTRHLTDPAGKVYTFTMEEGLYEIDVKTLHVTTLNKDANFKGAVDIVPGYHGKGAYSSQGRLVVANNGDRKVDWRRQLFGDTGCLAQWSGPGHAWEVVRRHQFTEVTGPGGIQGNANAADPLWAVGWDRRSLRLELLDGGHWSTFRLPMADFSYNASHGWYTEWPRIREVVPTADGQPATLLMNMHGGWFDFPQEFRTAHTAGLRPLGSYLKITADVATWQGRIVFGCDDTAITGGNGVAGQSQSNLWFTTLEGLRRAGEPVGWGGPWLDDDVSAATPSDPYLLAGYTHRVLHLAHRSDRPVRFTAEIDVAGNGQWQKYADIDVPASGYAWRAIPDDQGGQWIRLSTDVDASGATARLHYGLSRGAEADPAMFESLAEADQPSPYSTGIVRPRGGDRGTLQLLSQTVDAAGKVTATGYYEIGADMKLVQRSDDTNGRAVLEKKAAVGPGSFQVDSASVILTDRDHRYRLPKAPTSADASWPGSPPRVIREVATERDLLNVAGTFYVLPKRDYSMGVRGVKPVCSHDKRIGDFCSWRGLLVLTGAKLTAASSAHHVVSDDGRAALWLGDIDDLWKLGKPQGVGGPWRDTVVEAGQWSDPYLMTGYDHKQLTVSHDATEPVTFTVEVDVTADGTWRQYTTLAVAPGQSLVHEFPAGFSAHWVRLSTDRSCRATAIFRYE